MKFTGIALAAGALLATLGATPAPATVTLVGTNLSFSQMHAACSDALGGVTFSSGHVRFISSSNGTASSDSAATGIETISFAGASGAATAVANGHDRTVTAQHVEVRSRRSIACVFPDK
jgi:hypothetical protein